MDTATQYATALRTMYEEDGRACSKADLDLRMRIAKRALTSSDSAVPPIALSAETKSLADLTKMIEAAQLNLAANGEATALEGGIERGLVATKRAIRAAWVCLSACAPRKFPECNRLNNVVGSAARRGRSAFDSRPHLPAVEGVKARFHRSSHLGLGRPSHHRKFDSRIHAALYSDLRQAKSSCRNQRARALQQHSDYSCEQRAA